MGIHESCPPRSILISVTTESRNLVRQTCHKMDELHLEFKASLLEAQQIQKANAQQLPDIVEECAPLENSSRLSLTGWRSQ